MKGAGLCGVVFCGRGGWGLGAAAVDEEPKMIRSAVVQRGGRQMWNTHAEYTVKKERVLVRVLHSHVG